jgi:hypothetical protein
MDEKRYLTVLLESHTFLMVLVATELSSFTIRAGKALLFLLFFGNACRGSL